MRILQLCSPKAISDIWLQSFLLGGRWDILKIICLWCMEFLVLAHMHFLIVAYKAGNRLACRPRHASVDSIPSQGKHSWLATWPDPWAVGPSTWASTEPQFVCAQCGGLAFMLSAKALTSQAEPARADSACLDLGSHSGVFPALKWATRSAKIAEYTPEMRGKIFL